MVDCAGVGLTELFDISAVCVTLYILVFKHEPLIKIGVTNDLDARIATLGGEELFDLERSVFASSDDDTAIRLCERNLHHLFRYSAITYASLKSNGETETFSNEIFKHTWAALAKLIVLFADSDIKHHGGIRSYRQAHGKPLTRKSSKRTKRFDSEAVEVLGSTGWEPYTPSFPLFN